jgi:hypothetical protein
METMLVSSYLVKANSSPSELNYEKTYIAIPSID